MSNQFSVIRNQSAERNPEIHVLHSSPSVGGHVLRSIGEGGSRHAMSSAYVRVRPCLSVSIRVFAGAAGGAS